ncbi:MAG: hypothetical protein ACR2KK_19595, partial [Acidimicrobiales bacterium]
DELPRLIAKGRQEATGARFIGKMAVDMGQREAGKFVRQAAERLTGFSLVPDPGRSTGADESSAGAGQPAPGDAAAPGASASPPPATTSASPPAGRASDDALAIPGYDSLSAPQVVQRLDGLSGDELEAVRAYEAATRGRKTILSRIAQIQTAS